MIKKSKRTLEYERQWKEYIDRMEKNSDKVECPKHGTLYARKDYNGLCPMCNPKDDING